MHQLVALEADLNGNTVRLSENYEVVYAENGWCVAEPRLRRHDRITRVLLPIATQTPGPTATEIAFKTPANGVTGHIAGALM